MRWHLDLASPHPVPSVDLDPQQQRVVDHDAGPLLVLAGPGTGKTTTIVEAVHARLNDVSPISADQVLVLTFGRKAAQELRTRVTARLGGGLVPTISTFHSFAYALLRRTATPEEYLHPPRLMSGAEEDVRVRELLRGAVADGTVDWPADLADALPTLGLANEVRSVLARARELQMEGEDLARLGRTAGRPAWVALGQLARQEQDVMVLENVMDYGELMLRAVLRAREPLVASDLRGRYRAVFVDEFQDTDPLQVALLQSLVQPTTCLTVVGDPDQSIYGFRGADVGGLLRFPEMFRTSSGEPAPVVVLDRTRRFGPRIRSAATAALGTRSPAGLPAALVRRHRNPSCRPIDPASDRDVVTLRTFDSRSAQAAHIARDLRLAHLQRGVPWRDLAVLVRSSHQLPMLRRALQGACVPVVVAADEIPLRSEPAVAVLISAMSLAAHPDQADPAQVLDLLTGPLAGMGPSDLRRLGRALRAQHHRAGFASPPSDVLIRDLVIDLVRGVPSEGPDLPPDDPAGVAVLRLTALLGEVREQIESGALPQDVLWTLWSGGRTPHGWPQRLRAAALHGSRSADHDLDAVMALVDTAERLAGRYPGFLGVRMFIDSLADQQIPAESVAERGTRADAVRVLTAHRAKGLEWDEVWVVGLEEGTWPDLRARGSTLRVEELTASGVGSGPGASDLLEEERRLLYVACSRARHRLHLSAVDERGDGGERPSRFLDDIARRLGQPQPEHVIGRPRSQVTLDGLVAELRMAAMDESASPALRRAAVERLALLGSQVDHEGRPLVPLARPSAWWGTREVTSSERPVRDAQRPISLSGSSLDGLLGCPAKWFLEHEVRAETPRGPATGFGSVVHAIADFVAKGRIPEVLDDMDAEVDRVWSELRFEARWQSQLEREEARRALARFLRYHQRRERDLVSTESRAHATVSVPTPGGATEQVSLSGFIDRVERDDEGRLVPIDLKNMRKEVPPKDVPEHGQLGVYQVLLREAGLAEEDAAARPPVAVGGAALVQLRVDDGPGSTDAKVQFQAALEGESPTWIEVRLGEAAEIIRSEAFVARRGDSCTHCAYRTACPAWAEGQELA